MNFLFNKFSNKKINLKNIEGHFPLELTLGIIYKLNFQGMDLLAKPFRYTCCTHALWICTIFTHAFSLQYTPFLTPVHPTRGILCCKDCILIKCIFIKKFVCDRPSQVPRSDAVHDRQPLNFIFNLIFARRQISNFYVFTLFFNKKKDVYSLLLLLLVLSAYFFSFSTDDFLTSGLW